MASLRTHWRLLAVLVVTAVLAAVLASRNGEPGISPFLWTLLAAAPLASVWLLAAWGYGRGVAALLRAHDLDPLAVMAAGTAALLTVDSALARMGLLDAAGGVVAWGVLAVGVIPVVVMFTRRLLRTKGVGLEPLRRGWLTATPALATLLVAALSAPGWLWSSEFGGYDVLSYHLELPKEWLRLGAVQGLEHNVYSFFPSLVETAYYHLAVLTGDAITAAVPAQILHASYAILSAAAVAHLGRRMAPDLSLPVPLLGVASGVLVLATPWVIVTGSLAYDEMFVVFLLAGGWLSLRSHDTPHSLGVLLGLIAGAAVGAKLTAVGFVAVPLFAAKMLTVPTVRARLTSALAMGVAALIPLLPTLVSNQVIAGNPVFPFLTELFGSGHWTAEQVAIWHVGHVADASVFTRLAALWHQTLRYGLGPSPYPTEPWAPMWSVLPWLALIGTGLALVRPRWRRHVGVPLTILTLQLVFWMAFTHLKSRFLVPAVVPSALLAAIAIKAIATHLRGLAYAIITILALGPAALYLREQDGRPATAIGGETIMTGELHAALLARGGSEAEGILPVAPPAYWIDYRLPDDARILGIGAAAPFYIAHPGFEYTTVWDRGPLSSTVRTHGRHWPAALREQGFTHILFEPHMLERWHDSGWLDPMLDPATITREIAEASTIVRSFPTGVTLYALRPPEP